MSLTKVTYSMINGAPVNVLDFGAVGDGATDDTAAITAANAEAASLGKNVIFPQGYTFMASALAPTASWGGGGTIKRIAGSTGDFIVIGAADVSLDIVIDADSVGTANDRIVYNVYDGFQTAPTFIAKNGPHNGVESRNASNVKICGTIIDCVQSHVFVMADSAVMVGLFIDVDVDGTAIGTGNLNGGVKIHAKNGFDIDAPTINARVRLLESASMALNTVCLEFIGFSTLVSGTTYTGPATVIKNARVQGTVLGGSIGCTLAGCDDGSAVVIATGNNHLGLEITAGCNRSGYAEGSAVSAGPAGIGPKNGVTCTGSSDDCYASAVVSGVTNAVDAQAASFYVNGSARVTISGSANQAAGLHYIRNIDSTNLTVQDMRCTGTVTRAITFSNSLGNCDNARVVNFEGAGFGSILQCPGAQAGAYFYNSRFDNSSATLVSGSPPSFTNGQFINCEFTNQPFGTGAKNITVYDYVPGGASLITITRNGTPEGFITAKAGSTCLRDNGGAGTSFYVKETATGATGWVGK